MSFFFEHRLKSLFILFFTLIVFSSCNLIISYPGSRVNENDPEAQVTHFYAFAVDDGSVITTWHWEDWYNDYSEGEIKEIRILHSTLTYLQVLIPFIGESFTDSKISEHSWTGLDTDTTHYFALHMKDERNRWYAPLYAKATLPGTIETGVKYNRINSIIVDNAAMVEWMPDPFEIRDSKWAVVFFDIPDGVYIDEAIIYLSDGGTTAADVTFAPLNAPFPEDDMEIWNNLDNDSIIDHSKITTFTALAPSYDITEVMRAAALTSYKAILIKTGDPVSGLNYNNDASAPYIIADIIK